MKRLLPCRRSILSGTAASLLAAGCMAVPPLHINRSTDHYPKNTDDLTLRGVAGEKGLKFGAAVNAHELRDNAAHRQAFIRDCSLLATKNELKWWHLQPRPGDYNWAQADWLVDFAHQHNMIVHGHTLVWHEGNARWVVEETDQEEAQPRLIKHIRDVVGRYRGKIHAWDVVNEAVDPLDDRDDGLRETFWLEKLGVEYIDLAFRTAHEVDPDAVLIYNDYGLERGAELSIEKRVATLRMLEGMVSRDVPIQALGIQSHLSSCWDDFSQETLAEFLQQVADLGLEIMVSELDVIDKCYPADFAERDQRVSEVYDRFLEVALDQPAVKTITTWGLSDRFTWLNEFRPRQDGLKVRSLPYDDNMRRKPAWQSLADAFNNADERRLVQS